MGGKDIETDEQQKNKPDQPKVILKPLLKGIHGSSLTHFEVAGLIAEGNLPDLSRRAIHRIPINWPTGWATSRRGRAFVLSRCAAGNRWHSTVIRIIQLLKGGVNDRITNTDAGGIAAPQLLA